MCGSQNVQGGFYAVLFGRYNITELKRRSGRGGGDGVGGERGHPKEPDQL